MAKQTNRRATPNAAESVAAIAALGGKMPPQVLEFEEVVLGALLIEQDAYQDVAEILKPEHFYTEAHQRIFAAMQRLNALSAPIDLLTMTNELKRTGELDAVGGRFYLVSLTQNVASAVNIEYHARMIFEKYMLRSIIQIASSMQTAAYDESSDVSQTIQDVESQIYALTQAGMKRDAVPIAPVIQTAIEQMKEASQRADGLSGVPSGFPDIDRITSGWQKATMVVIAARPAMGKTAFVLSMARRMALDHNKAVAIFSLEMSNVELVKRLMVAETEIKSDKIKNGRLTNEEWTHFMNNIDRLNKAPIYIDDTEGLSVFDLRSKCRVLKKKYDIQIVIIDYLQLMTASAMRPGNRQEEVSMISRSLKGLSKELEIPVIALSQLNRSVEQRTTQGSSIDSKRPQLSDLRESGAIEQDADMVCFIHRPEYYKILNDENGNSLVGMAQFIIAKHRSGAIGDVLLRFQAELSRFEDAGAQFGTSNDFAAPVGQQTIVESSMNYDFAAPPAAGSGPQDDPFLPPPDFSDFDLSPNNGPVPFG